MRPPNVTSPPPSRARHVVDADAAGVERDGAVDRLERVRQREVAEPAVAERRAAGRTPAWSSEPVICALSVARPAAADVAEEALQDPEVGVARRLHVDRLVLEADVPVELELRALAGEPEPADLERRSDRAPARSVRRCATR